MLKERGFYDEAQPLLRRALEGRANLLGWQHRSTLAAANDLALLLEASGLGSLKPLKPLSSL